MLLTHFDTTRLRLRPFSVQDLSLMRLLDTDPEVVRFLGHGRVKTPAESQRSLSKIHSDYEKFGLGLFAAYESESAEFVGRCGLIPWTLEGILTWEIGYSFVRSAWGKGYATEAATEVARWAQENLKVPYVISLIHPENLSSMKVAEKVGMVRWKEISVNGLDLVAFRKEFPLIP